MEAADDLLIHTPYSKTVVEEKRAVPRAAWDGDLMARRVPFLSWEDVQRRWPTIKAAAQRNERLNESTGSRFGKGRQSS